MLTEFLFAHVVVGLVILALGLFVPELVWWWMLAYAYFWVASVRELVLDHKRRQAKRKGLNE
jgi:hypothetical protein